MGAFTSAPASASNRVLLSEDMDRLGSLALLHKDADSANQVITMSGRVAARGRAGAGTLGLLGLAAALLVACGKRIRTD